MAGAAAAPGPADLERAGHHDILCVRSELFFLFIHGSAGLPCTHSDADADTSKQQMRSELPNPINSQAPKSIQIAVLQWYKYTRPTQLRSITALLQPKARRRYLVGLRIAVTGKRRMDDRG